MKDQSEGTFSSVIPANQYGVLHAEFRTGIVTDQYGHRVLMENIQDNFQYLIFISLDYARAYAEQKIMGSPEIECHILNERVDFLRNTEYMARVLREERERNEARRSRKPWWKLW